MEKNIQDNNSREITLRIPVRAFVRPKVYTDPNQMEKVINKYFDDCDADDRYYTIEGLALACGFSNTQSLMNYQQADGYEMFHDLVRSAKLKIQMQRVENMQKGKLNVIAGIFLLVNGHKTDYKQKPDMTGENAEEVKSFLIEYTKPEEGNENKFEADQKAG
jgi:hypothetical protein